MPRIPGPWAVIFRFMRAARNEILVATTPEVQQLRRQHHVAVFAALTLRTLGSP